MKPDLDRAARLLCRLQDTIRNAVGAARGRRASRVAAVTAADTIYVIDRVSETAVLAWFAQHWPRDWPVELVMEGREWHGPATFPKGTSVSETIFKCILDPIDGTRGLMYDKRSAWSLAALAPQRGARTHLGDIVVAAMTELPTSKQTQGDQLSVVRGHGVRAMRVDLRTGRAKRFTPRPSQARDVAHGLRRSRNFFPPAKPGSQASRKDFGASSARLRCSTTNISAAAGSSTNY